MKTLLAISGICLAIASAITLLVIRAVRRNAAGERQAGGAGRAEEENHRPAQQVAGERRSDASRVTAPQEAGQEAPKADEEHRTPAWDEARRETEGAHLVAAVDAPETAEEEVPWAGEATRTAVHQESEHQADEVRYETGEALVATPVEASEIPEEEAGHTDETLPISAQPETARRAGHEARQQSEEAPQADELSRTAAQQESERGAEDEASSGTEETHVATAAEAPKIAEEEASQSDELSLTGTLRESDQRAEDEARRDAEERLQPDEISRTATQYERERRAENQAAVDALQGPSEEPIQAGEEHRIPAEQEEARHETVEQVDSAPAGAAQDTAQEQCAAVADELTTHRRDAEPELHPGTDVGPGAEEEARGDVEAEVCLDSTSDFPELPVLGPSPMPARAPRQYRPVARVPAVPPVLRSHASTSVEREARDRSSTLSVRLIFEKGGFSRVSLLPRRGPRMPPQVAVSGSSDPPELVELQEEWYQDVILPEMGHLLREGLEWAGALADGQQVRWSLSGREIYVLAPHDELAGFVSVPRMMLGEQHVVLCISQRLEDVRAAIALTNSPEPELLDSGSGVPAGWVGLRGVIPHTPVAPSATGDILDALRPLPEIAISLEGGIKIERQTWLSGYPPRIRLRGDTGAIEVVLIDGREASLDDDGGYVVPGWDAPGDHSIWCTAGSRTYSIREGAEEWEPWDAFRWSQGDTVPTGVQAHPAICGVLVRPPPSARTASHAIEVPVSNPVLIGAVPGEIYVCTPRRDIHAGVCVGFPGFEPVWAIPADALHCDKRRARILLVGKPHPVLSVGPRAPHRRGARGPRVAEWCAAIRLAGQKGLQTEPSQSDVADLWRAYKQMARALWRNLR